MRLVDVIESWIKEEQIDVRILKGAHVVRLDNPPLSYQQYTINMPEARHAFEWTLGWIVDDENPYVTFDYHIMVSNNPKGVIRPGDPNFFDELKRQLGDAIFRILLDMNYLHENH